MDSTGDQSKAQATRNPKPAIGRELITAIEFAELLSISERTLYRLRSIGQLPPPIVLGGSVRWRLAEIRDWIAKGCPAPADT